MKFNAKLTNNKNYPDILNALDVDAKNINEVVKFIKQNWGLKVRKIYEKDESTYSALVNGNRFLDILAWEN